MCACSPKLYQFVTAENGIRMFSMQVSSLLHHHCRDELSHAECPPACQADIP